MSSAVAIFAVSLSLSCCLSIVWSTLRYGISPTPSSHLASVTMVSLPSVRSGARLIDLGSGWGQLAYLLAREHPNCSVCGYERSLLPYLFSRLFFRRSNLQFHFVDFYEADLPNNAILFCYLYPRAMQQLAQHLRPFRGILISNTFALPNATPQKTVSSLGPFRSKVYLYHLSGRPTPPPDPNDI